MDPYEGFPPGFQSLMEWTPPSRTRATAGAAAPMPFLEPEDEEENFVERLLGRAGGVGEQLLGGLGRGGVALGRLGGLAAELPFRTAPTPLGQDIAENIRENVARGATEETDALAAFYGEPEGKLETAAAMLGRMAPEMLPYVAGGAGLAGLATTPLRSVATGAAVGAPLDVLYSQALPKEETVAGAVEHFLPGFAPVAESRLGRAATEVVAGGIPGAAVDALLGRAAARRVAGEADRVKLRDMEEALEVRGERAASEAGRVRERRVEPLVQREEVDVTPDYVAQLFGEARQAAEEAPPRIRERRSAAGLPEVTEADVEAAARARAEAPPLIETAPGPSKPAIETIGGRPYARTDAGEYVPVKEDALEYMQRVAARPEPETPPVREAVPPEPEIVSRTEPDVSPEPPSVSRAEPAVPEEPPQLQPVSGSIRAFEQEIEQLRPGSPAEVGTDLVKVRRMADGSYNVAPAGEEPVQLFTARAAVDYAAGAEGRMGGEIAQMEVAEPIRRQRARRVKASETTPDLAARSGNTVEYPVRDIQVDPERFQFKIGMGEGGASGLLRGVERFDPELGGVIMVWKDPTDGRVYVVNGHHRLDLAKRTGTPAVDVRFIKAADASEARKTGALANMAEGRGTPIDAAKFMRETGTGPEDLRARSIPVTESVVQEGLALRDLHPAIFGAVTRGEMPVQRAVVIGRSGLSENQQLDLLRLMDRAEGRGKRLRNTEVEALANEIRGTPTRMETQETLFGVEQYERSNIIEKAEVGAYVKEQLAKDKRLFQAAARIGQPIEQAGVGRIDVERAGELGTEAQTMGDLYGTLSSGGRAGELTDILNEEAALLAAGKESPNAVKARALQRVRSALEQYLPGGRRPDPLQRGVGGAERAAPGTAAEGAPAGAGERLVDEGEVDLFGETRPLEPERPPDVEDTGTELRFGGGPGTEQIREAAAAIGVRAARAQKRAVKSRKEIGTATRSVLSEATDLIRSFGPTGKKIADQTERFTRAYQAHTEQTKLAVDDVFRGLRGGLHKKDREKIGRFLMGHSDGADLSPQLRQRAEQLRSVWDRDLAEAQQLGFMRQMPDGEWVPVAGSGHPMPQYLNDLGREKMDEMIERGGGVPPRIQRWAEEMAEKKGITVEEALDELKKLHDPTLRRPSGYLERARVLLPEEWVELDPLHVNARLAESNARVIEAAKVWGLDYSTGKPQYTDLEGLLDGLGGETDEALARSVKQFYQQELGTGQFVQSINQRLASGVSNYETAVRLGASFLSMLRNVGQRFVNTADYPLTVQLRALKQYPPVLNRWMKEAQKLERKMLESGAVSPRTASLDITRGAGEKLTKRLLQGFTEVEKGNQVYTALVARMGLEYDINHLAKLQGKDGPLGRFFSGISERRTQRALNISAEDLAAKVQTGERLTGDELEEAAFRLVNDTQFPINFATKALWWDSHPWWRATVAKFKTFGVRQMEVIWDRVIKEAAHGNVAPLARFTAGTVLLGEIYNIARDNLMGSEESLTSRARNKDQMTGNEVAWTIAKNLADGGGVGMLADLTFGVGSFVGGPAYSTILNVRDYADAVMKRPGDIRLATRQLLRGEVSAGRQIGGLVARAKPGNDRYFDYKKWRNRVYEWRFSHENPSLAGKAVAKGGEIIGGQKDFESTDRTLRYRYAADAITANEINDATEYLTSVLEGAKDAGERKALLAGIRGSMRSKSPLGQVGQANMREFRSSISEREWQEVKRLDQAWLRDYESAIQGALRKVR